MTPQQKFTAKALGVLGLLAGLLVVGALVVEGIAVSSGGNSTISELMWMVWANQPWVVLLVSHILAAPFWFLAGHFFAQGREVYDRIRREQSIKVGCVILAIGAATSTAPPIQRMDVRADGGVVGPGIALRLPWPLQCAAIVAWVAK